MIKELQLFTRGDNLKIGFIEDSYECPYDGDNKFAKSLLFALKDLDFAKFKSVEIREALEIYSDNIYDYIEKLKKFKNIKMDLSRNMVQVENVYFQFHDWGFDIDSVEEKIVKIGKRTKIYKSLNDREIEIIKSISDHPSCDYRNKSFTIRTIGSGGSWNIDVLKNKNFNNIEAFEDKILQESKIIEQDSQYAWIEFENLQYCVYMGDDKDIVGEYQASIILNFILDPKNNKSKIRKIPTIARINKLYKDLNIPEEQIIFFKKFNLETKFFSNKNGKIDCLREFYINKYSELNLKNMMVTDDSENNPFTDPDNEKYIDFNMEIDSHKNTYNDLIVGTFEDFPDLNKNNYYDLYFGTNTTEEDIDFLLGKDKNTGLVFVLRMVGYGWGFGMYE